MTGLDTLAMLFPNVATTHGITVRVAVSYLAEQSDPSINRWFWSYHVRIENGKTKVKVGGKERTLPRADLSKLVLALPSR